MKRKAVELVVERQDLLGEGPSWDAALQQLYWIDILGKRLYRYRPQVEEPVKIVDLPSMPGCVTPRQKGGVALALQDGYAILDLQTGLLQKLTDPEAGCPDNRFNDGKCDPRGRFLAGTMSLVGKDHQGSLYSLSPAGKVETLLTGVSISNGLAWSPDQHTLYYIDTPTRQVMAYDYDLETGAMARPHLAFETPAEAGYPDGMTADREGNLWVAMWQGAKVMRWDPLAGKVIEIIPVPALNVTSCVFGGPDLRDLYITSARQDMTPEQIDEYPLTGSLFCLRNAADGAQTFAFAG